MLEANNVDVLAALVDQVSPGALIVQVSPLLGGVSAETSAVTFRSALGEEKIVVRRHRDMPGKPAASKRAEREAKLLSLLQPLQVQSPRLRLFSPPQTLLLGWVEGTPDFPWTGAEPMASALARIHAAPLNRSLSFLPRLTDPLPLLREWLADKAISLDDAEALEPFAGDDRLVHGDYWPGNLLWRADEVAVVLDWEDALVGDPMIDVAAARCELNWMRDEATVERFTDHYERLASVDEVRLRWWDLFISTAFLRHLDGWGLPAKALHQRRTRTREWQTKALAALRLL